MNRNKIALVIREKYYLVFMALLWTMVMGCEDFVDIEGPTDQLTGEVVFMETATVDAALAHIYAQLRNDSPMNGKTAGISNLLGHYTDEIDPYRTDFPSVQSFHVNEVLTSDSNVRNWWVYGYQMVYAVNRILEGVDRSSSLQAIDKDRFMGEAYFLRAYLHFHLSQLFGDIPYPMTSDYRTNSKLHKMDREGVHQLILEDLLKAKDLLAMELETNFRPNHWVASAFLARVYLYHADWEQAFEEAYHVIQGGRYLLGEDLQGVFLKDSPGTLWQLDTGVPGNNTNIGFTFRENGGPPTTLGLSDHLVDSFEPNDGRFISWVGTVSDGTEIWHYPLKYKQSGPTETTQECFILIRLAEMYLIAAESQFQRGEVSVGLPYLNAIRIRASLPPLIGGNKETLLEAVQQERKVEFFTELGHRFFDLKRTGRANAVLTPIKPSWGDTDLLFPIPETELLLNPNLLPQNEGY